MKKILASFGSTFFSFLLAMILATAVWVNAVATQDPDETRTLSVPLAVTAQGLKEGLVAQGYQNIGVQVTLARAALRLGSALAGHRPGPGGFVGQDRRKVFHPLESRHGV